jgi:hypothetical protein
MALTHAAPPIPGPQIPALERLTARAAQTSGIEPSDWQRFTDVLAPLAAHNAETYAHSLRVGLYAHSLATIEGLDARLALHGGCAHDLGKCLVPNAVLRATDFSDTDRAALRSHPRDGQRLLAPTYLFSSFVAGLHHQFQPNPYGVDFDDVAPYEVPAHLRKEVYVIAELVATCDFYDALTTRDNTRAIVADHTVPAQLQAALVDNFSTPARARWLVTHDLTTGPAWD